jgi:hypothetical protein
MIFCDLGVAKLRALDVRLTTRTQMKALMEGVHKDSSELQSLEVFIGGMDGNNTNEMVL